MATDTDSTTTTIDSTSTSLTTQSTQKKRKPPSPFDDFNISSTEVLDHVAKAHCPKCHRNSRYFCYKCLILVGDYPEGSVVPQLKLPIHLDIIKHEQERDGKSTALHAGVLAPTDVSVYEWNKMPEYQDVDRLLLLFPSEGAKQLSEIDPASFDKLIVIDGTWEQAKKMSKSSTFARMKRVTIAPHETLFWRYQRKASDHLATIEAIYFFLREYHETYLTHPPVTPSLTTSTSPSLSPSPPPSSSLSSTTTTAVEGAAAVEKESTKSSDQEQLETSQAGSDQATSAVVSPHAQSLGPDYRYGPYTGQFDDMLWFYKYFYELIQHTYRERSDGKKFTQKHRRDYIQYD
ncbi:DTW domain-containing protein 1 [Podila epigama]|nr:DTW domain-containing protein 1 [Podila epigama]